MVSVRFIVNALLLYVLPTIAATTGTVSRDLEVQKPTASFDKDVSSAEHDGFYFENPETDCKYVSQPYIYKAFKTLETDLTRLFTLIHRDVDFTIVGHHPGAGKYHDLMHFFVNALRRVSITGSEHNDAFKVIPKAIHGGCDQEWSVAEINFQGITNSGMTASFLQQTYELAADQGPNRDDVRYHQRLGYEMESVFADGGGPDIYRFHQSVATPARERKLVERHSAHGSSRIHAGPGRHAQHYRIGIVDAGV